MAAISTIVAAAAVVVSAAGVQQGIKGRREAKRANENAARENSKAREQQRALNAQEQANERRAQIREERVRRAHILQAAENSGVAGSSGEIGAMGGMATQLAANIGLNLGRAQGGNAISGYLQNAADFNTAAQSAAYRAQNGDALFSMSQSIFSAAGGVDTLEKAYKRNFGKGT